MLPGNVKFKHKAFSPHCFKHSLHAQQPTATRSQILDYLHDSEVPKMEPDSIKFSHEKTPLLLNSAHSRTKSTAHKILSWSQQSERWPTYHTTRSAERPRNKKKVIVGVGKYRQAEAAMLHTYKEQSILEMQHHTQNPHPALPSSRKVPSTSVANFAELPKKKLRQGPCRKNI